MIQDRGFIGIILAAGESTRMRSEYPKVLHPVLGRPMLDYIIRALRECNPVKIVIVVGYKAEQVIDMCKERKYDIPIEFVIQEQRLGTAHAVRQTAPYLEGFAGDCLILCGDTPLIRTKTLQALYEKHTYEEAPVTLLTAYIKNPKGYGRILRDEEERIRGIVEEKDTSADQKRIKEINTGVYCFKKGDLFDLLKEIGRNNMQGEYYLTDAVSVAQRTGLKIADTVLEDSDEILGVNSRAELAVVTHILKERKLNGLMINGVTFLDPLTVYVDYDVCIEKDTVVYPHVVIEGRSSIGKGCTIFPFTYIKDACIGEGKLIGNMPLMVK